MTQEQFEKYLSRQMVKRRLTEVAVAVVLLVIGIVCNHLREASKQIVHGTGAFDFYSYAVYNDTYLPFIIAGLSCGMVCCLVVFVDLLLCKYRTVHKGQQYLTVYRGMVFNIVYVDGVEKGRIIPMRHMNMIEVWLAGPVRATVHFTTSALNLAHISFSDHTATMEV